jgi:hypothetical protein
MQKAGLLGELVTVKDFQIILMNLVTVTLGLESEVEQNKKAVRDPFLIRFTKMEILLGIAIRIYFKAYFLSQAAVETINLGIEIKTNRNTLMNQIMVVQHVHQYLYIPELINLAVSS